MQNEILSGYNLYVFKHTLNCCDFWILWLNVIVIDYLLPVSPDF